MVYPLWNVISGIVLWNAGNPINTGDYWCFGHSIGVTGKKVLRDREQRNAFLWLPGLPTPFLSLQSTIRSPCVCSIRYPITIPLECPTRYQIPFTRMSDLWGLTFPFFLIIYLCHFGSDYAILAKMLGI